MVCLNGACCGESIGGSTHLSRLMHIKTGWLSVVVFSVNSLEGFAASVHCSLQGQSLVQSFSKAELSKEEWGSERDIEKLRESSKSRAVHVRRKRFGEGVPVSWQECARFLVKKVCHDMSWSEVAVYGNKKDRKKPNKPKATLWLV